jgi:hypothetical protein
VRPTLPNEPEATPVPVAKTTWRRFAWPLVGLLVIILAVAYPFLLRRLDRARWRRRRVRADATGGRVAVSWDRTTDVLSRHHVAPLGGETPFEFADRATKVLVLPDGLLPRLADTVTRAAYAGEPLEGGELHDAERVPLQIGTMLRNRMTLRQRTVSDCDPRPLFRGLPGDKPRRRRFG